MKRKTIIISLIVLIIAVLWISGVIPMFILKTIGMKNFQKEFPKWELEFVSANWERPFGSYSVKVMDFQGNIHYCMMRPKYFPVSLGEGYMSIAEDYKVWCFNERMQDAAETFTISEKK